MDQDFGVRHFAGDEVDLSLDHGKVAMRPALQHETATGRTQVLKLAGINPHVERKHGSKPGHDFLGRPAFALLIDDVGLQEHAAAHGQARHRLRFEGAGGVFLERNSVALGHALQECAVAGRALRVQAEVGDRSLPQHHDLHVGAADVADHVCVREDMQSRFGVRDGFDHAEIGAEDAAQEILAVAGESERGDPLDASGAEVAKQRLGVLMGLPFDCTYAV